MDFSIPGFPVLHHPPKLAQTHVHQVGEAIQPSYPLSCPSPPTINLSPKDPSRSFPKSQLFASGGQRIGVSATATVFPMNIQDRFPLGLTS